MDFIENALKINRDEWTLMDCENNIQDKSCRKQLRKKTIQIAENPLQAPENKKQPQE